MYDIIQGTTANELIANVNTKMNEGWAPIGGLVMLQWYGQNIFLQSMVKQDNSWYGKELEERK